jgi:hypothetical protein
MTLPVVLIIFLPAILSGSLSDFFWASALSIFVLVPLFGCGMRFRGRPLFQFHYHGEPFEDEVMSLKDDELQT